MEWTHKYGVDTLAIHDSVNILGVEVDSKHCFDSHLKRGARKASLRVTLLRRIRNLLDADALLKLYKAQVRPIIEQSPTSMSSAQGHLSLLDKVQRRAERLIAETPTATSGNTILGKNCSTVPESGAPSSSISSRLRHTKRLTPWSAAGGSVL